MQGGPAQFRGGERYTNVGSVWSVDSPPVTFQLIEYYREIGLPALLTRYFGEDPVLSVRKWVVRCAVPNNALLQAGTRTATFLGMPHLSERQTCGLRSQTVAVTLMHRD